MQRLDSRSILTYSVAGRGRLGQNVDPAPQSSSMQQLSIGAVAKLTDIPAHTLRKWETRHGIATPMRSPTGRRVYTAEQVEMLRLIKLLVDRRHALAQLGQLTLPELEELADLHAPDPPQARRLGLIGPNVCHLLLANDRVVERYDDDPGEWANSGNRCDTVVIETPALSEAACERLLQLGASGMRIIVVYQFASRKQLHRLVSADIICTQAPLQDTDLLNLLDDNGSTTTQHTTPARFTTQELARIAALTPSLECECPNHIAQLLMDIAAFEHYSEQCVDTDPEEKALHEQLSAISAQARRLFEDALIAVTRADGLTLNLRDES